MAKGSKTRRHTRTPAAQARKAEQPRRTDANRERRRAKHVRKHPNDKQTGALL